MTEERPGQDASADDRACTIARGQARSALELVIRGQNAVGRVEVSVPKPALQAAPGSRAKED